MVLDKNFYVNNGALQFKNKFQGYLPFEIDFHVDREKVFQV